MRPGDLVRLGKVKEEHVLYVVPLNVLTALMKDDDPAAGDQALETAGRFRPRDVGMVVCTEGPEALVLVNDRFGWVGSDSLARVD